MNESWHTYEWVMSHMWMSHVAHMNESCRTCECVMSHISIGHVTHVNESCLTQEWVMSHIWIGHEHLRARLRCIWMKHVTHMNQSCHTHEWVMSHIWMSHVSHLNESVLQTQPSSCVPQIYTNESCLTHEWVMSPMWMSQCREPDHLRARLRSGSANEPLPSTCNRRTAATGEISQTSDFYSNS